MSNALIRFMLGLVALPLIPACVAPAAAPDSSASERAGDRAVELAIPFELERNRIFLPVHVNGRGPYRFMLDTGASGIGRADTRLVAELGLPKTGTAQNSDSVTTSEIDVVQVNSLRLGNVERKNVQLFSRDYNRTPSAALNYGLIGRDFFGDGTLTIDYPARMLRFSQGGRLDRSAPGVVRYETPFIIPFHIGDRQFEGLLDTGSNLTLHLPMPIFQTLRASPPQEAGTARRANTVFHLVRATLHDRFRIGTLDLSDVDVRASKETQHIQIGGGVLHNAALVIDQVNKLLLVRPSSAVAPPGK